MINKIVKIFLPVLLNLLLPGAGFILSLGQYYLAFTYLFAFIAIVFAVSWFGLIFSALGFYSLFFGYIGVALISVAHNGYLIKAKQLKLR